LVSNRSNTTRLISLSAILYGDTQLPPDGRGEETDDKWRETKCFATVQTLPVLKLNYV